MDSVADSTEVASEEPVVESLVDEVEEVEEAVEDDAVITVDSILAETEAAEEPVTEDEASFEEIVSEEPVIEETAEEVIIEEEPVIEETAEDVVIEEEPVIEETAEEVIIEEEPVIEEKAEEVIIEEEPVIEETAVEPEIEEATEESDDTSFDTVDSLMADDISDNFGFTADPIVEESEEPVIEETIVEDSIIEESIEDTIVEEPAEDSVIEEPVEKDFSALDGSNNNLSESNIDYLTAKDSDLSGDELNTDLKKDIKSVLLYMDQLLENLPEDKIIEFAKSDEFTTYKKLFSELGLS